LWSPILDTHPNLWIWLGDNIYADTEDMEVMRQKYARQLANEGYRRLRTSVPVIGIWDDHDYGANDAGKEYPKKVESQ
jgi:alkaline phosphatase D